VVAESGQTGLYAWNTSVTENPADPGLKTVVVVVTWAEKGTPRSVHLENLLSSR
jgi:hypothetical protein